MTTEQKKEHKVNWTHVIIGGTVLGGGFLLYKILQTIYGGSEADRELAREIMIEWQQEFDVMKPYMESIYYGGREPTEQELAILSSMLSAMEAKEATLPQLSKSIWKEFEELAAEIAASLWLTSKAVALLTISGISSYVTYKIVREWKNRRNPPPNFPCQICGAVYSSAEALKTHVEHTHPVTLDYAIQAQTEFIKATTWIQNAVAVEHFYSKTYTNWKYFTLPDFRELNWNIISTGVYGIGSSLLLYKVALWMIGIPAI